MKPEYIVRVFLVKNSNLHKKESVQTQSQFQVYNASAGSGKTFTLVKEYLKILLRTTDVFRFQNILAITFTNKAAAEMKERVLNCLQDFSEGKENAMLQIIAQEVELSDDTLSQRATKVLDSVLQNYSAFNITTIDSFTHRIIRSFAFDLGLSLNFEVEMDPSVLLDEAVDVLISKIGQDKGLTEVLIAYSLDKADDDKSWDISRDLKDFSRILLNENHFKQLKSLKGKTVEDFKKLKAELVKEINQLKDKFGEIGKEGLEIIENEGLEHKDFYYSMLPKHFLYLSTDINKAGFFDQNKLKERIEENNFYSKSKSDEIKNSIESILPRLLDLYLVSEKLYQKYVLNNLVLKSLVPLAVLNHINETLEEIKEQNNIRLNAEFNQLISEEIKNELAPFIYERIGEKFRYYFIDEMQDTSELQWKNLIPLIENALSSEEQDGERGSLMLVGDAKQAIYRWRGGKAEQFIELSAKEAELKDFTVVREIKNLDTNYRSNSEIIAFNNQFFTYVSSFLGNEDYKKMYVSGNNQLTSKESIGYVEVSLLNIDKNDLEKETIYPKKVHSIIENLDLNFDRKDVCVLVRTKKQGIAVSDYLTQNNIPIISSETLLLKNNETIEFLIHIFTMIYNPSDEKAIVNALYFLGSKFDDSCNLHEFLSGHVKKASTEIFKMFSNIGFDFDEKEFMKLPFYDGVEYILRSFKLMDVPNLYVQSFLDFVLEYEQKRGQGLNDFLEYWERKKETLSVVLPEGQNAVQVMTIHKAKGLEFPVVIFPYDLDIYREQKPKIWYENLSDEYGFNIDSSLLDYSKKISYISSYGAALYNQRKEEVQLDNLNLLYVALTRPVEQLYIITKNNDAYKDLDSARSYSDLFLNFLNNGEITPLPLESGISYEFGDKSRSLDNISREQESIASIFQKQFISNSWLNRTISIATNSSKLWNTEKGSAIVYGNLIHHILAYVKWDSDVKSVLEKFYFEGQIDADILNEIELILNKIVTHDELLKYYQLNANCEVINEKEIRSSSGKIQIPDRVWTYENKVVIIDYKTGVAKRSYHVQINDYALTFEEMGYEIEKKLLVYIDSKIVVEEVF